MPWPIYSERLLATDAVNAWVSWTVPAGRRAVIKSVSASDWSGSSGDVQVTAAGWIVMWHAFTSVPGTYAVDLMAVVYGGETVSVYNRVSGCHVVVNGYLFDDPTRASGPPPSATQLPGVLPPYAGAPG